VSLLIPAGVALGAVLAAAVYRPVVGLLVSAGAVRPNYAGRNVPVGGGLVFVLATLLALTVQWTLVSLTPGFGFPAGRLWAVAFLLVGFALLGLSDDLLGSRETGGFGGHFRLLLGEGRLTSGALKALGGAVVAAWPAVGQAAAGGAAAVVDWWWLLALAAVNLLVIALTANAVNLLDLRPGRAFKGFLLLCVMAMWFGRAGGADWVWLASLLGAAAVFGWHDLRAEVMMGDTGANPLGALVGLAVVWSWSGAGKLLWLAGLVAFHLYTERTSLSATIERVTLLRWLDRLGRPAEGKGGTP
jgi:UDP-N-acetylmuramyl pentapeptide phosphotransferase/UDP-N-acetylglucosamine-1-phosphate transferase